MGIESYSTTPASNNSTPPNGAPEGMAPSKVNDIIRQVMADTRTQWETPEWFNWGDTLTYASATSFTISGDVTARYPVSRRMWISGATTGNVYGIITASSYSAPDTTVTISATGSLQSEALTGYVASLTPTNPSYNSIYSIANVKDFGAVGDGITDDTTKIQNAIDYTNTNNLSLYIPNGTYICSSNLDIYQNTNIFGSKKRKSILQFTHTGDGINSTWPINSSTAANISIKDLSINNNNLLNTGGGFVDVGGSFVDIARCYFSGWKDNIILDQSEVATIDLCEFQQGDQTTQRSQIWIVNGAEHSVGALKNFTNKIIISRNQFNTTNTLYQILDEGGVMHTITGNNFNAGGKALYACGVNTLSFVDNESEGHTSSRCISITDSKITASEYVGPCQAVKIESNVLSEYLNGGGASIGIDAAIGGSIKSNGFAGSTGLVFDSEKSAGMEVSNNTMLVTSSNRTAFPIFDGTSAALAKHIIKQTAMTYSASSVTSGSAKVITPVTMSAIKVGSKLLCYNETDGTNSETIKVLSVTGTTFTADFASAKNANFVIIGIIPDDEDSGAWTPVLAGTTTPGTHTYNIQKGTYQRRGNLVHVQGTIDISSKDATWAGNVKVTGLPFAQTNISNDNATVSMALWSGFTLAASYQVLSGIISPAGNEINLRKSGSGVALTTVPVSEVPGSVASLYFNFSYHTNDD